MRLRCSVCGTKFMAARSDAKTCSVGCRKVLSYRRSNRTLRRPYKRTISPRPYRPRNVHFSSRTIEWPTPQGLFDTLNQEFSFTLDAAATADNAKCAAFYTRADDGLSQPWEGTVWLNPPYGRTIAAWMAKALDASRKGATVVSLVPARTDTRWWHDIVCQATEIRYLKGRLRHEGSATRQASNAPFPSAVVIMKPVDLKNI